MRKKLSNSLTIVLDARCLSQTFPLFSATFLRLTGSYGIFLLPSNSCPLDSTQVVILPPFTSGVSGLVIGVSAREDTLDTALEGGLEGGLELALEDALEPRLGPIGSFQLFKDALPICIGDISVSFVLLRLVCKSFCRSSDTNLLPLSASKNLRSAACMSWSSVSRVGKA